MTVTGFPRQGCQPHRDRQLIIWPFSLMQFSEKRVKMELACVPCTLPIGVFTLTETETEAETETETDGIGFHDNVHKCLQ